VGAGQVTQEEQIPGGVFALPEDGAEHRAGSVIDRVQQDQGGPAGLQPGMVAAVHLDEETRAGHPLTPLAVLRGAAPARTAQAGGAQDAMDSDVREDEIVPLR